MPCKECRTVVDHRAVLCYLAQHSKQAPPRHIWIRRKSTKYRKSRARGKQREHKRHGRKWIYEWSTTSTANNWIFQQLKTKTRFIIFENVYLSDLVENIIKWLCIDPLNQLIAKKIVFVAFYSVSSSPSTIVISSCSGTCIIGISVIGVWARIILRTSIISSFDSPQCALQFCRF